MARPSKHVVVIGPGAIGCMMAVRLAKAGPRVTLIDHRADRAERLGARPIIIHTPAGDLEARIPVRLAPDEPPDFVILATKAHAARTAAEAAAGWIADAPLLTIQNGLGVTEEVAQALPRTDVITGVIYQGANVVAEGEVAHVANLKIHVGYIGRPGGAALRPCSGRGEQGRTPAAEAVAALLGRAGLPAVVEADMRPEVWGKLIVNAAINPVAALAGVTNGAVAARPTLRALAQAVAEEGEATARAEGIALPYRSAVEAALDTARKTADNRCSMLQDLEAGRPTEIDYLNGAIVREAERHGVATPAGRALAALVRQVSAKRSAECGVRSAE
jgi:2-dehydropantoate 2-reductase